MKDHRVEIFQAIMSEALPGSFDVEMEFAGIISAYSYGKGTFCVAKLMAASDKINANGLAVGTPFIDKDPAGVLRITWLTSKH